LFVQTEWQPPKTVPGAFGQYDHYDLKTPTDRRQPFGVWGKTGGNNQPA